MLLKADLVTTGPPATSPPRCLSKTPYHGRARCDNTARPPISLSKYDNLAGAGHTASPMHTHAPLPMCTPAPHKQSKLQKTRATIIPISLVKRCSKRNQNGRNQNGDTCTLSTASLPAPPAQDPSCMAPHILRQSSHCPEATVIFPAAVPMPHSQHHSGFVFTMKGQIDMSQTPKKHHRAGTDRYCFELL